MITLDPNDVAAFEIGLIRVYTLDLPMDKAREFATDTGAGWPLKRALGADPLDSSHTDTFDVADFGDMGLIGYLVEGHDIEPDDLETYGSIFAQLTGPVVIITSRAFEGVAQTLVQPALLDGAPNPLRHIATLRVEGRGATFEKLPAFSAKGVLEDAPAKKVPSDAAMSGRVATIALLVMALLVWMMIRIAG